MNKIRKRQISISKVNRSLQRTCFILTSSGILSPVIGCSIKPKINNNLVTPAAAANCMVWKDGVKCSNLQKTKHYEAYMNSTLQTKIRKAENNEYFTKKIHTKRTRSLNTMTIAAPEEGQGRMGWIPIFRWYVLISFQWLSGGHSCSKFK